MEEDNPNPRPNPDEGEDDYRDIQDQPSQEEPTFTDEQILSIENALQLQPQPFQQQQQQPQNFQEQQRRRVQQQRQQRRLQEQQQQQQLEVSQFGGNQGPLPSSKIHSVSLFQDTTSQSSLFQISEPAYQASSLQHGQAITAEGNQNPRPIFSKEDEFASTPAAIFVPEGERLLPDIKRFNCKHCGTSYCWIAEKSLGDECCPSSLLEPCKNLNPILCKLAKNDDCFTGDFEILDYFNHCSTVHTDESICYMCNKKDDWEGIKDHILKRECEGKFQCRINCYSKFEREKELLKHRNIHLSFEANDGNEEIQVPLHLFEAKLLSYLKEEKIQGIDSFKCDVHDFFFFISDGQETFDCSKCKVDVGHHESQFCSKCMWKFEKKALEEHLTEKVCEAQFQCRAKGCNRRKFDNVIEFVDHKYVTHTRLAVRILCEESGCGINKVYATEYYFKHKPCSDNKDLSAKCPHPNCNEKFGYYHQLIGHLKKHMTELKTALKKIQQKSKLRQATATITTQQLEQRQTISTVEKSLPDEFLEDIGVEKYQCEDCHEIYTYFSAHMKMTCAKCKGTTSDKFQCLICPQSFNSAKGLVNHKYSQHPKKWKCAQCGSYVVKKNGCHQCENKAKFVVECPQPSLYKQCGLCFGTKDEMYTHMKIKREMTAGSADTGGPQISSGEPLPVAEASSGTGNLSVVSVQGAISKGTNQGPTITPTESAETSKGKRQRDSHGSSETHQGKDPIKKKK